METIHIPHIKELLEEKELVERKLNVKLSIKGHLVRYEGSTFDEYEAGIVLDAIAFGYPVRTALLLKDEEIIFEKLNIKNFTRRKDLEVIRARLIGSEGRTKKTIENIADCKIIIGEKQVGILCKAEEMEYAITAITNLIRGSKQSNVYKFLERINTQRKNIKEKSD